MFQIAGLLNTDKINKNNYLTSQLIEYIRANYEKPLSLYSIADEFNRSTPYISRLIKQTTGKILRIFLPICVSRKLKNC